MLTDLLLTGLLDGARIGVAALGFALIFYTTKELHFAYGAILAACGYLYYSLVVDQGLPLLLAAPLALAFGAVVGAVIQRWLYRRLNDHLAVLLFSFGMAIILENVLHIMFGPTDKVLPAGALTRTVSVAGTPLRVIDLVTVAVFLVVWAGLWHMLERQQIGLAIRAVMRDSTMSDLVGIRTGRIKVLAYALGSAIGAVAGLIAVTRSGVRPGSGFDVMLFAFIATLLGAGKLTNVAAWSLALGLFMGLVAWPFPTELQTLFAFFAMLIYLVVRSLDVRSLRRPRLRRAEDRTGVSA
ncbi:branched-chain amino acid ABC transporter permease [Ornithinimicrobium cavernae]|uniref:branched-chain amino acid ABC transporter permease n=1 Tax=Ornithinimicrobium cavernae TaxID=2666047 RepID=UPI000D693583|nr:branched-chain amino acid ABC transporter permease [Ornithinimicrobium cavernae]